MRDATRHSAGRTPETWREAFNALPLERPDTDAWSDIAARLPVRKRMQWPTRLAIAAALALAVIVPLRLLPTSNEPAAPTTQVAATSTTTTQPATPDALETLYAESAQLEGLLALARDDSVASGAAVEVGADLDSELARIDAALRQPHLDRDGQLALWRARVDTLRSAVSFESTRRWMAVHGERYDGALVRVD
ncbi:hypothetical protein [Noviluteimonas gilva]|uniref:Uncharacterized protein n=1 Tax=Noviluteimonas gilva TaxID=2682097 RepID=A0A7C9HKE6_9GAMM|nr:hypothetical protein [Lysobacter gilvus]MUV12730.1 hypothetical protein [Lysobacter gilvus]